MLLVTRKVPIIAGGSIIVLDPFVSWDCTFSCCKSVSSVGIGGVMPIYTPEDLAFNSFS